MATVDDLLRTLHRQAAALRPTGRPDRQLRAHIRGWVPLATNALRVLDALDPRPEDRELYGLLRTLRRPGNSQRARNGTGLEKLALTMGAIGDAITTFPEPVAQAGQGQRSRLQASIEAALHATARTTLDIARSAEQPRAAELFREVSEVTELAALLPPSARVSSLERLTVTRLTTDTVDGAVRLWAVVAQQTFANYRLVTGVALQDAAATLALLCQVTADTLRDAARRPIVDPSAARHAARIMGRAAGAWRQAAAWPSSIQLGGRAHEHQQAVRAVRSALTGPPLTRLTLRERVHTLQAAVSAAVAISDLQARTVARVASHGGLWMAHERPNLRPPGVERRQVKLDWELMDPDHPAGRVLIDRARFAQQCLVAAADATDRAVLPSPPVRGEAGHIAMIGDRIVATWWDTIEPTRVNRPENEAVRTASHDRSGIPR